MRGVCTRGACCSAHARDTVEKNGSLPTDITVSHTLDQLARKQATCHTCRRVPHNGEREGGCATDIRIRIGLSELGFLLLKSIKIVECAENVSVKEESRKTN